MCQPRRPRRGETLGVDAGLVAELTAIVERLHAAEDEDLFAAIAVGPLESLFHQGHEEALWPEIERLARQDPVFRKALAQCWAYSSPMYDRRADLLIELGASDDD